MRFSADDEYKKQEPKLVCFSKIGSHKSHVTLKRGHFPGGRSGQLTVVRLFGGQARTAPDTPDCQGRQTAWSAGAAPDTPDCQGRRTAGTAKDDGQLGTVSAAGSRPNSREHSLCGEGSSAKGEGSSAKIENPSGSVLYSVIILDNRVKFARSHVLPPAKHSLF